MSKKFVIIRAISLIASVTTISTVKAQADLNPMPVTESIDRNGVDLTNWGYQYVVGPISIGPSNQDPLLVNFYYPTERDSFSTNIRIEDLSGQNSTQVTVSVGSQTWNFVGADGSDPGAYLSGGYHYFGLTTRDGMVIEFAWPSWFSMGIEGPVNLCASKITKRDGEVLTFYNDYDYVPLCRTRSIESSRGYQIRYDYSGPGWSSYRSKITLINTAYEYCSPSAISCSLSMPWPSLDIPPFSTSRTFSAQDGRTWIITPSSIKSPGETSPGINWTSEVYYPVNGYPGEIDRRITSVTRDGKTWNYSYPSSDALLGGGADQLIQIQDPLLNVKRYRRDWAVSSADPNTGEFQFPNRLNKSADELGNVTTYGYNSQSLVNEVTLPEGNKHMATYDPAGNILTYTLKAKPGSGIADATTTYIYGGCCNDKPTSVTDAKGNTTDYTYDPVHGGVLTESGPAPSSGAPRPVKRYAYSQHYAWVKSSSGSYVQTATPIWLLDSEKRCLTSATVNGACSAGPSDEVTTTYDYGPNSGPNNLWLRGKVVTADGISLRTCYRYDAVGNMISETAPRAGLTVCP